MTPALRGVDLEVSENEIFALIGLNGSGKTTTIKLLLGLLKPDEGNFKLFDSSVVNNKVKQKIGYLPEIPYFNGDFTPREMLRFWGALSDLTNSYMDKGIDEVLNYTSLSHVIDRKIKGFSRGMLQRLGLAQALLSKPQFLILDEPMGGLDPKGIIDIRELMLKLKKDGKTIFFTSHIIAEVEKIADKVGILHEGKVLKIMECRPNLEEEFLKITELNS
ncbi:ABC transporter ATP-binding protein [Elusimicrobiota bacterium]